MLTSDQIQARLNEMRQPDAHKQRDRRIAALNQPLRKLAFAFLYKNEDGKYVNNRHQLEIPNLATAVDKLSQADRQLLFETYFPEFHPYVETTWQLFDRLPYTTGYQRRPFRAPTLHHLVNERRCHWLTSLLSITGDFPYDIEWYATWAGFAIPYYQGSAIGLLLAGAIEAGDDVGEKVFEILLASARGEHDIGIMGRHIITAFLTAEHTHAWDFMEKLLLAAQREEGLRQTILETIDEARPELLPRFLHIILDQGLLRFSAVARAVNVWFGVAYDSSETRKLRAILETALQFMEESASADQALHEEKSGQAIYLALWTKAFWNVSDALPHAEQLVDDEDVMRRLATVEWLTMAGIRQADDLLVKAVYDDDLRVALRAWSRWGRWASDAPDGLFPAIEHLLKRLPDKPGELPAGLWEWQTFVTNPTDIASSLAYCIHRQSPERLIPYLSVMDIYARTHVVHLLEEQEEWSPVVRDTLFELISDRSSTVREAALTAIEDCRPSQDEILYLEGLLRRKSADLRRGVIRLLLNQEDPAALESVQRLLGGPAQQRLAALDILQQMVKRQRSVDVCQRLAEDYDAATPNEAALRDLIVKKERTHYTRANVLGLINPQDRTPVTAPQPHQVCFVSPAALACIETLDTLIHDHCHEPVQLTGWDGVEREELLGNLHWGLNLPADTPFPLIEIWEDWFHNRLPDMVDRDGLELLRAYLFLESNHGHRYWDIEWTRSIYRVMSGDKPRPKVHYPKLIQSILQRFLVLQPLENADSFVLDGAETILSMIPDTALVQLTKPTDYNVYYQDFRQDYFMMAWLSFLKKEEHRQTLSWCDESWQRLWQLLRWIDEPIAGARRHTIDIETTFQAYQAGAATEADLYDQFFADYAALHQYTKKHAARQTHNRPELLEIIDVLRQRMVEVETSRGDMPTPASAKSLAINYVEGIPNLVRILRTLGKERLVRGYQYDGHSKSTTLSNLLRVTFPASDETPDELATAFKQLKIGQKRILEVAVYAPQWAALIEAYLGWPGLEEAVWWIHAHTKDNNWRVDTDIRDTWTAQIGEYTPLTSDELMEGAVDVSWFRHVVDMLGLDHWQNIYAAAKLAASGAGHKRAQLFADALLGEVSQAELQQRITKKRYQDAVRALGLIPLENDQQILERYETVQEFVRGSRQFGSQRQASERLAADIALANLARNAGYSDPQRLMWAMETRAVADLKDGPITVELDNILISLHIDEFGDPHLQATKDSKRLKTIPKRYRKLPEVAQLTDRKRALSKQTSRMRAALEQAMIQGTTFRVSELRDLLEHPLLKPMVTQLIFIGNKKAGYLSPDGKYLEDYDGEYQSIRANEKLRLAHPYDLLESGNWHEWQHDCFIYERVQPFKQVFRELYVLTETEQLEQNRSQRYAGHQVQPRQAAALLKSRKWVIHPDEGIRCTYHETGLSAWLTFLDGAYTPVDVEGWTLDSVMFTQKGQWKPLLLEDIPPPMFSEVMRDVDLVVSVAHRGGIDPEASLSTIAMRSAVVEETCELLDLSNVKIQKQHVLVDGMLSTYSVHLGSGIVHRQPGGSVCIIPVHSQHRGRLFLPFVDDDPRTAEVVSKVILLANDSQIKDPTILEQLTR